MHVVVEAVFNGRTVAQVSTIDALHGLTHDVGRAVPEDGLRLRVVELEKLQGAVSLEHTVQIPHLAVHLGDDGVVSETLTNAAGHFVRSGLPGGGVHLLAIGQCHLDGLTLLGRQFGLVFRLALLPEDIALLDVLGQGTEFCNQYSRDQ